MATGVSIPMGIISSLDASDLGVYIKGKGLLQNGKNSFTLKELGGDKEEARVIITRLIASGHVEYIGGGCYALAKMPSKGANAKTKKLAAKMKESQANIKKNKSSNHIYSDALLAAAKIIKCDIPRRAYAPTGGQNKPRFRRIIDAVCEVGASPEQFAQFVFLQDWGWCNDPYPPLGICCTDEFLAKFIWFVGNISYIKEAAMALRIFDATFSIKMRRLYPDFLLAMPLANALAENNRTMNDYISYLKKLPWVVKGNIPVLKFITTNEAIARFIATIPASSRGQRSSYLNKILSLLDSCSVYRNNSDFEDSNWTLAEAILEPLAPHMNGFSGMLSDQMKIVRNNKAADELGFYLITRDSLLTPLAVYWLLFAAEHLPSNFYSGSDWHSAIKAKAAPAVNESVFDTKLESIT